MVAVPIRSSYLVANDTTQGTEKNQLEAYLENTIHCILAQDTIVEIANDLF